MTESPAPPSRIAALDALRGLAVAGIVLMNVFAFSMPPAAYYNPRAWGGDGPLDLALWAVSFVLVEDKFRNLFAMMFGAGVAILLERARASGVAHPWRGHFARMAVLLAIGWLHALLLSSSDVLRLYALCGLVLPFAAHWPAQRLWLAAAAMMALHLAVGGWIAWGWLDYWWQVLHQPGTDPAPLRGAEMAFGSDPEALARGLTLGSESLAERIARRANPLPMLPALAIVLPATLSAMLAGVALWRSGLLSGGWRTSRLLSLGFACTLGAIPPLAALAAWSLAFGLPGVVVGVNSLVFSAPFDLILAIGWAALAMALFSRNVPTVLAAAGRMALTNYLATSIVLASIFASWGFGLFGEVTRLQAYGFAFVPVVLMFSWSRRWLTRFRHGPVEWLWRSLAQGRALPFFR